MATAQFDGTLSFYTPPARPANERARQRAVEQSPLLHAGLALRLHDLVMQARFALRTRMAALTLITHDRQRLIARAGIENEWSSRASSFCGHAILKPGSTMVVGDAAADDRFAGNPLVLGDPHIRFYAGTPLVTPDGHALGTLCVFDPAPRAGISCDEEAVLHRLADRAMTMSERSGG